MNPPSVAANPTSALDPFGEEYAFQVASYAWAQGLTANKIAQKMGLAPTPLNLLQVKRALKRAHGKFLQLKPLMHDEVRRGLEQRFNIGLNRNRPIAFHVVNDAHSPPMAAVAAKVAELVLGIIMETRRSGGDQSIIVNSGGRTVYECVRAIQRHPPPIDFAQDYASENQKKQTNPLLFVAANAAYDAAEFAYSANFLSVTLAQLFDADHNAREVREDSAASKKILDLVDRAALFICGVGTPKSGMMFKLFDKRHWPIPPEAVGDIAFNFLDRDGLRVKIPTAEAEEHIRAVNPFLDVAMLQHLAARARVILILDAEDPATKQEIARAVLSRDYCTDVVLGSRLGKRILEHGSSA